MCIVLYFFYFNFFYCNLELFICSRVASIHTWKLLWWCDFVSIKCYLFFSLSLSLFLLLSFFSFLSFCSCLFVFSRLLRFKHRRDSPQLMNFRLNFRKNISFVSISCVCVCVRVENRLVVAIFASTEFSAFAFLLRYSQRI